MSVDLEPIAGALAWRSVDFPDDRSWVRPFEREMLLELENAARALLASGAPLKDITAEDFDLPTTDRLLTESYSDVEKGCGFSLLSGLPVDDWGVEISRTVQCIIGTRFGLITKQNREGDFLLDVINKDVSHGTQNRGYHSNAFLDFHNDGANTVALLCMETAAEGGESLLVSAPTVYNEILKLRPDLLKPLMNGFFSSSPKPARAPKMRR